MTWEQFQELLAGDPHDNVAVFMASDQASGMTGTVVNLSMGSLDDQRLSDRGFAKSERASAPDERPDDRPGQHGLNFSSRRHMPEPLKAFVNFIEASA